MTIREAAGGDVQAFLSAIGFEQFSVDLHKELWRHPLLSVPIAIYAHYDKEPDEPWMDVEACEVGEFIREIFRQVKDQMEEQNRPY